MPWSFEKRRQSGRRRRSGREVVRVSLSRGFLEVERERRSRLRKSQPAASPRNALLVPGRRCLR
ncbi:hypothetical protein ACFPRL_17760 [Pseudoclavibacter helvolus]